MKGRNVIEHEPANKVQPFEVYWIAGKKRIWRGSFSTEAKAQTWIDSYGDRPPSEYMA